MNHLINKTYRTAFVIIGIGLNFLANHLGQGSSLFWFCGATSMAFLLLGCFIWTKLKNRHWAFMFWGLLAPIGLLGISLLQNKTTYIGD